MLRESCHRVRPWRDQEWNRIKLFKPVRQRIFARQVVEPREPAVKLQLHRAGGAVALFADDDFGLAVGAAGLLEPFLELG